MNILVVKLSDIGDLLTVTPALALIKQRIPEARVDVLTTPHAEPVLNNTELAYEVLTFDKAAFDSPLGLLNIFNLRAGIDLARTLHANEYDIVLVMHHLTTRFGGVKFAILTRESGAYQRFGLDNGSGWFLTDTIRDPGFGTHHEVEYWLAVANFMIETQRRRIVKQTGIPEPLEVTLSYNVTDHPLTMGMSKADLSFAERMLGGIEPWVAIHPGSGGYSRARRWDIKKWAALADALTEQGCRVVLVGGLEDDVDQIEAQAECGVLNLAGRTTLGRLGALIKRCDAFFGADSGVMHIAAAVGTYTVALFGPSNADAWGPWSENACVIRSAPLCSPCSYVDHRVGLREGCTARTCMKMVRPEHVLAAYDERRTGCAYALADGTLADEPVVARRDPDDERVQVLDIPVDDLVYDELLDDVGTFVGSLKYHQIATANPEFVMIAQGDDNFRNILRRTALNLPDGIGLVLATRIKGQAVRARITGSDGVPKLIERAAGEGWRVFLLGAAEGVAAKAADILEGRYPGLKIVGTFSGSPAPEEEDAIAEMIRESHADIVLVAYGAPAQDKWLARNAPRLGAQVGMGIGGTLDFITGVQKRAPVWMRRVGLEWLYRLIRQPSRWRRMLRLPRFLWAAWRDR
jgi:exopolysaccharide biosynthesis WecB/TagA/CpsF family protein